MLRGAAAWSVVLYHCFTILPTGSRSLTVWDQSLNPIPLAAAGGWLAVTLFFVISGFSIASGLRDHRIRWAGFFAARWLRIAPLYLLLVLIGVVASAKTMADIFGMQVSFPVSFAEGLSVLPFIKAYTPFPWLATAWSVRVEWAIYLFVPLMLVLVRLRRRALGLVVLGLLCVAFIVASAVTGGDVRVVLYSGIPGRLAEFALGFALAYFVQRPPNPKLASRLGWGAAIGFVALEIASTRWGGEWSLGVVLRSALFIANLAVCAGLLLWATAPSRRGSTARAGRAFAGLGRWSYSTYMWHYSVIALIAIPVSFKVARAWGLSPGWRLALGIGITVGLVAPLSFVSFRFIEKPFLRFRPRYVDSAITLDPLDRPVPALSTTEVERDARGR